MRVIEVAEFGGPEVLTPAERPDPAAGPGQVVVRIRAANVNPTDLAARAGHFARGEPEPPFVLGWDLAGDVSAVGEGVEGFEPGDRVVGMIHWYDQEGRVGAYAEAVAVEADWIVALPEGADYAEASTIPLNALTARQGLETLDPPPGAELLVTGASGAVGGFFVQMAVAAGHRVTAVGGRRGEEWLRELGASEVLPRDVDLSTLGPFGYVFDAVPLGEPALAAVEDGGRVVTTRRPPESDPARRLDQRVFLIHADRDALEQLVAEFATGRLRTRVARTLPLGDAAEAHRLAEAGGLGGKVVLTP